MADATRPARPTRTPNPRGWPDQHYYFMYGKATAEGVSIDKLVLRAIEALAREDGMYVAPDAELVSVCPNPECGERLNRDTVSQWMLRKLFWKCKRCLGASMDRREAWYRKQAEREIDGEPAQLYAAGDRRG